VRELAAAWAKDLAKVERGIAQLKELNPMLVTAAAASGDLPGITAMQALGDPRRRPPNCSRRRSIRRRS